MTILFGFDPGTTITGYAVIRVDEGNLQLLDFGAIRPPPRFKLSDRYLVIYNAISELLDAHQGHSAAVESQFVGKNPQSAIKLGMARGMVLLAVKQHGMSIYEYAPTKAKLAATGTGKASKQQVQRMMQLLFKLPKPPEPEDAADALAIAVCHAHSLQARKALGVEV